MYSVRSEGGVKGGGREGRRAGLHVVVEGCVMRWLWLCSEKGGREGGREGERGRRIHYMEFCSFI
jgi:hypothetical protein